MDQPRPPPTSVPGPGVRRDQRPAAPADKGVRKFRIALITMALTFAGFLACHWFPNLGSLYPGYCVALVSAAGVFSGTNVLEKMKGGKADPPA